MGEWILWGVCGGAALLTVDIVAFRGKQPLRRLFVGAVQGLCALAAVNVAGAVTGVSLGISWLSLAAAGLLGIPGVTLLLLLQWICG